MQKPSLKILQDAFFSTIVGRGHSAKDHVDSIQNISVEDSLAIYSRGYIARLTEALGETFEATWWVLGDEDFMSTCKEYIAGRFSSTADISDFGLGFPDFLKTSELGSEIPFLYDLARFEWVFRNAFHSENLQPLAEDMFLNALQAGARLALSPTVTLFNSRYSVYEIWKRRSEKIDGLQPDEWMTPSQLVVFKKASKVMVFQPGEVEFRILEKIAAGCSIDEVLTDLIGKDPTLNPDQVRTIFGNVGALGVLTPSLGDTRDK